MAVKTLLEIRNSVMTIAGIDTADTTMQSLVDGFINDAYADVCIAFDFDWLRVEGGINLTPTVTTGTVGVVGTAVTGVGTAFDSSQIGSYMQLLPLAKESHRIVAVTSTTALTLANSVSQTVTASSSYMIFTPDYVLDSQLDPSTVKFVSNTNKTLRLEYTPEILLERYFPNEGSIATSDTPRYWCVVGASLGYPVLRFFPIPNQYVFLKFVGQRIAPELTATSDVPLVPTRYEKLIKYGALALTFDWHGRADMSAKYGQKYEVTLSKMRRGDNNRATYGFPREPNDLPKPRLRKFILRLPGAYGGNVLD